MNGWISHWMGVKRERLCFWKTFTIEKYYPPTTHYANFCHNSHQSLHPIPLTYLSFETALISNFIVSVIAIVVFVYFLFSSYVRERERACAISVCRVVFILYTSRIECRFAAFICIAAIIYLCARARISTRNILRRART